MLIDSVVWAQYIKVTDMQTASHITIAIAALTCYGQVTMKSAKNEVKCILLIAVFIKLPCKETGLRWQAEMVFCQMLPKGWCGSGSKAPKSWRQTCRYTSKISKNTGYFCAILVCCCQSIDQQKMFGQQWEGDMQLCLPLWLCPCPW